MGILRHLQRFLGFLSLEEVLIEILEQARKDGVTKLDLSRRGITKLPSEIGQVTRLTTLDLSGNKLSTLPPEIGQLTNLTKLDIYNNRLSTLPPQIGALENLTTFFLERNNLSTLPREMGQLSNLTRLNLSSNKLSTLPPEIRRLSNLTTLDLHHNQLSTLPPQIGALENLTTLDLSNNKLWILPFTIGLLTNLSRLNLQRNKLSRALPPEIGALENLTELDLSYNELSTLPPEIGQLTNLAELDLSNNQLSTLSPEIGQLTNLQKLDLRNNPLPIPPEILQRPSNPSAILEYFRQEQRKPLNEAKLIFVGEGRVGKTSLVRRLVENRFDEKERITEGISIKQLSVTINSEQIRLNIWDFGGQEIMHATHQFFLTLRSLYILVLDAERGEAESRIDYWLKLIQSFGKDSPIIVVSNKSDLKQLFLNQGALREEYSTIKGFVNTSCKEAKGIGELVKHIRAVVGEMKHVRDQIPAAWLEVKAQLEGLKKDYITYDTYVQLCHDNNIREEKGQRVLVRLLHDLGIVLNFQDDPRLRETSVLNPEWVTGAVYQIINAKLIEQNKGLLEIGQLDHILDGERYPKEKHLFIIDLMRKFELCFDLEGHTDEAFLIPDLFEARVLIPDVLPKEESKGDWPVDSLTFEYHYDFLPRSVISRLMVRLHRFIFQESYWLNGMLLVYNQNKALVKALPKEKKIVVSIIGGSTQDKPTFWAIVRDQLQDIHLSIQGLNAQVKIRHEGELIDYTFLRNLQQQGISETHIPVGGKIVKVNVRQLLEGVDAIGKPVESKESRALQEILAQLELRVHPQKYYRVTFSLGRLYYEEMDDYSQSRPALVKAHEAIEALRGMVQEAIQVQLSTESVRLYQMLVQCFLVEGDWNKAFEYAAVGKGRAFINKLAEASFDLERLKAQKSPFASKLEQARQKREQIDQLEKQLATQKSKRDDLLGRQSVLLREEAELWREMERDYPVLTATLTVPTLSAVQARHLARELGATLVEYYCHAGGWCAFVVTGDQIRYVPLPALKKGLLKRLIRWRNRVHLPAGRSPFRDQCLAELYDAVIAPLSLNERRVIIAPFKELHLVPLAAAYNQRAQSYLAEEHVLSFAPSLTALHVFNQEQKRRGRSRRLISKLIPRGKRIKRLLSVAYPGKEGTDHYLPNVLPEAGAIIEWLSKMAKVDVLHEEEATPDNVLKRASNYDAIHFGCHGSFDSDNPTQSGLHLAGEKPYLTVQDIITQLNLKQTRLVTLAACLSGQVALQAGEEHIGLLQALMTAGAPTIVASLWSVDDAATRALFTAFYTRQISINAPAQAMRDAAALLREKERWAHPYYWAAFQVNGLTEQPKETERGGDRATRRKGEWAKERLPLAPSPPPIRGNERGIEWPPDLLKQIDIDYQRSFTSQRGEIMKDQLFMDNAELLFEDMVSAQGTLAALKQYPLPDEIAGLPIQNSELGIADAIHYIVLNNPTLRQRFLPSSARDIEMLKGQLTKLRGRVTPEIHQPPVPAPNNKAPILNNDVHTVRKALIEALNDSPPSRDDEDDESPSPNAWQHFKAKFW